MPPEERGNTFVKDVLTDMAQEYGGAPATATVPESKPSSTPPAAQPASAPSVETPKSLMERCEELAKTDPEFASAVFDFGLSRMKLPEKVNIEVKSVLDGLDIPQEVKDELEASPAMKWLLEKVIKERVDPAVQYTIREGKESEASRLMDRLDKENADLDAMLGKHNLQITDDEYKSINALAQKADVSLVEAYRARFGEKLEKSRQSAQKRIEIRKSTPGGSRDSALGRAGDGTGKAAHELTVADIPEATMAMGLEKGMTSDEILWGYKKSRRG